jgi:HEAT repeat protein
MEGGATEQSAGGEVNMQRFKLFLRIILATLLIWAALSKLANPTEFLSSLYGYELPLSKTLLKWGAIVLPWMEFLCGIFLITETWIESVLLCTTALMMLFVAATGQAWLRGLQVSCGCFDLRLFGFGTRFPHLVQLVEGMGFAFTRNVLLTTGAAALTWSELGKADRLPGGDLLRQSLRLRNWINGLAPRLAPAVAVAVGVTGLIGSWHYLTHRHEPYYEGKPLSFWVRHLDLQRYPAESLQAVTAVRRAGTNAVPVLTELLQSKDSIFKLGLKRLLSFQHLWKVSFDLSPERKRLALRALTILGPGAENALSPVEELFLDGKLPMETANALAAIGKKAIPGLVAGLKSPMPQVRFFAAQALRDHAETLRAGAAEALLGALQDEDAEIRLVAAQALRLLRAQPPEAVEAYCRSLADPSTDVRIAACQSLALCGKAALPAAPELRELLLHPDADLRQEAAQALRQIDADQLEDGLFAGLHSNTASCRAAAAELLGQMRLESCVIASHLIEALHDQSPRVRFYAAHALACYPEEARSAVSELSRLTRDSNSTVQQAARYALAHVQGTDPSPNL